jgi:AraC-like DNA-binding protein
MPQSASIHIDLRGRPGDVTRHPAHHGIGCPRHRHEAIELNIVTGGRGSYLVGDQRLDLAPGRLVWLFAENDHILASAHQLDFWIVYFDPKLLREAKVCHPAGETPLVRDIDSDQCQLLHHLCLDLTHAEPGLLAEAGFTYLLHRSWMDTLSGRPVGSPTGTVSKEVRNAIAILREGRDAPGLSECAHLVDLTPSRFAKRFSKEVGSTYLAYRERVLVERACAMWKHDDAWEDIATKVGFGSYRQFHRAFSRVVGCTPRRWRTPSEQSAGMR